MQKTIIKTANIMQKKRVEFLSLQWTVYFWMVMKLQIQVINKPVAVQVGK